MADAINLLIEMLNSRRQSADGLYVWTAYEKALFYEGSFWQIGLLQSRLNEDPAVRICLTGHGRVGGE